VTYTVIQVEKFAYNVNEVLVSLG